MQAPITKKNPKFTDERGWFISTHTKGLPVHSWLMQNTSMSYKNTLRGLHYQAPYHQTKLITVIEGTITDVVLDIDPKSPTYGQWQRYQLSSTDPDLPNQIYIPNHYAHGFAVTSDSALITYLTDEAYHPEAEHSIHPLSPNLAIPWDISNPILSKKDANAPKWELSVTNKNQN
jgi:dTDP-4-dehydrorhamnose 3,5-epimerase